MRMNHGGEVLVCYSSGGVGRERLARVLGPLPGFQILKATIWTQGPVGSWMSSSSCPLFLHFPPQLQMCRFREGRAFKNYCPSLVIPYAHILYSEPQNRWQMCQVPPYAHTYTLVYLLCLVNLPGPGTWSAVKDFLLHDLLMILARQSLPWKLPPSLLFFKGTTVEPWHVWI